jgi:hypothetical protein
MSPSLRPLLEGGDRRSTARADDAAAIARADDAGAAELWILIADADPLVRMRAADALEKASRARPDLLLRHKAALLADRFDDGSAELRWHLLAMAARLPLAEDEIPPLLARLDRSLRDDPGRIVKVMALQAAADIAARHRQARPAFDAMLDFARRSSSPAVAARARKLMRPARRAAFP